MPILRAEPMSIIRLSPPIALASLAEDLCLSSQTLAILPSVHSASAPEQHLGTVLAAVMEAMGSALEAIPQIPCLLLTMTMILRMHPSLLSQPLPMLMHTHTITHHTKRITHQLCLYQPLRPHLPPPRPRLLHPRLLRLLWAVAVAVARVAGLASPVAA